MKNIETHEIANIFPLMKKCEFDSLKADIVANGLLEPIWLYEGKILDGRNRFIACQEASVAIQTREYSGSDPVRLVFSLNKERRHLDKSQLACVAVEALPHFEAEARKRQLRTAENREKVLVPELVPEQESRNIVSERFEVNPHYVSDAKKIKDVNPELFTKVATGEVSLTQALRQVKKEEAKAAPQLPDGKYRIIYADPPWSYGNTQPDYHTEQRDHYGVMSLADICALPIKDMAEDNSVLFLWVTSPILEESFQVIKAWGFKYKTSFVWDKVKHNMGHYNSVRHELLLVCTRGACTPDVAKLFDSVVTQERTAHSEKPAIFYEIIETIYTYGKRIELFARNKRDGWDAYGNQA